MINRTVILSFLLAVFMANMLYAEEEKKESDWDTTALPAVFYDIVGIYDNVLYAVTNDNAFCAFNNNTGDILWKHNMPSNYMLNATNYVIMSKYIVILSYMQRFADMFKDETIVSVIDKSNGRLLRRATATRQNGEALKGVAGVYGKYIVCQGTVFAKDARATIYDIENMRIIFDENGDLFMWDKYICKCLSTAEIEIVYDLELGTEYKREIHLESPLSGYFICVGNKIVTMYDWKDTAVTRSDYSILIMSMNGKLIDRLEVKGCQKLVMTNKDSKRLILEGMKLIITV